MRTRIATGVIVLAVASGTARADEAGEAQALFDQGIADLQAGKLDAACKELGASLAKHEDSGTKGALATCDDQIGRVASAWQLWKDLADTAPTAQLRTAATAAASADEPRLPRYVVKVAAPVAGEVVTVGKGDVTDFSVSVPLPIDPGEIAVAAKAPGYAPWTGKATAAEGKLTTIEVPALVAAPESARVGGVDAAAAAETRHQRRLIAYGVGGAGVAALIVGGVFGARASSEFSNAKNDCGGMLSSCPGSSVAVANSAYNSAHTDATASTVLFVVGAAAVATAAVVWFTAPHAESAPAGGTATSWRVAPVVDPNGAGLVVLGGF